MRKIILNLAISLDGYIADENRGYAWITGDGDKSHDTEIKFDFSDFMNSVDTVVMGRNAYEDCDLNDYKDKTVIVATTRDIENYENVKFVKSNIDHYVMDLKESEGKDIWLFGGSILTDAFIKSDCVDQYIIGIIPIILGKGIPLFRGENPTIGLRLLACTVQEGVTILKYTKRQIKND